MTSFSTFYLFSFLFVIISSLEIIKDKKASDSYSLKQYGSKHNQSKHSEIFLEETGNSMCDDAFISLKILMEKFKASVDSKSCVNKLFDYQYPCSGEIVTEDCYKDATQDWESTAESNPTKASCCRTWDDIDCIFKKSESKCTDDEFDALKQFWNDNSLEISSRLSCNDYVYGSAKCHFPWWAILIIVLGALFIIIAISVVIRITRGRFF